MFAVIYRSYVKAGFEAQYRKCWTVIASHFINERGALESTLHQAENGMWVAYSKWPDKATRDAAWPRDNKKVNADLPIAIKEAIYNLKSYLEEENKLPEICMEVIEVAKATSKN